VNLPVGKILSGNRVIGKESIIVFCNAVDIAGHEVVTQKIINVTNSRRLFAKTDSIVYHISWDRGNYRTFFVWNYSADAITIRACNGSIQPDVESMSYNGWVYYREDWVFACTAERLPYVIIDSSKTGSGSTLLPGKSGRYRLSIPFRVISNATVIFQDTLYSNEFEVIKQ
jgi:hypothetical protein